MDKAMFAFQMLADLGMFFLGIGALWYVSLYQGKKEE